MCPGVTFQDEFVYRRPLGERDGGRGLHSLLILQTFPGLLLGWDQGAATDSLLITQTQTRHTRSSVSVRAVPGWAVLSTCPQEAHTPEEGTEPAQANPQGTGQRGEYQCFQTAVGSSSRD